MAGAEAQAPRGRLQDKHWNVDMLWGALFTSVSQTHVVNYPIRKPPKILSLGDVYMYQKRGHKVGKAPRQLSFLEINSEANSPLSP